MAEGWMGERDTLRGEAQLQPGAVLSCPVRDCPFPQFSRPEFLLLAAEAPVTLHLPGSVVVKVMGGGGSPS